jgi:K+-sensing histidine kinase KdpD
VGDLARTLNELIAKVQSTLDAHRAFLADSSHELRRPLAVMRGNLEVLKSGALPAEEREQVIGETEAESRRMSRILADLLLLSQVDARLILQMQRFDLGEVLKAVNGCAHLGLPPPGAPECPVGQQIPKAVGAAIDAANAAAVERLAKVSVADLLKDC